MLRQWPKIYAFVKTLKFRHFQRSKLSKSSHHFHRNLIRDIQSQLLITKFPFNSFLLVRLCVCIIIDILFLLSPQEPALWVRAHVHQIKRFLRDVVERDDLFVVAVPLVIQTLIDFPF